MSRKYQKIVIFIDTEDNKNVKKNWNTIPYGSPECYTNLKKWSTIPHGSPE